MKMLYCRKCGAAVITDEDLAQRILDRANEAATRAIHCPGKYKPAALHEAAGYRAMYKALMHNISKREYAEAVTPLILTALTNEVKARGLMTETEIAAIYDKAREQARMRKLAAEKEEQRIYGDFEAACNRANADPTSKEAIANIDRERRRSQ